MTGFPWYRQGSKYGNRRAEDKTRSYMSQGERDCAAYLQLLQKDGAIRGLEYQVSIRIGPCNRRWILDFKYFDCKMGKEVWADYKGLEVPRWLHLIDLWILEGPGPLIVYKGHGLRIGVSETILPRRKTHEADP